MANDNPFQTLFESLGQLPRAHAEAVNRQAYEILHDILTVPPEQAGRCVLLRAPRAGHGKTHMLSRIQHHLATTHEFVPLRPAFGSQIDAGTVLDDALCRLLRPLPASGGLCVLDLVTRRLFAVALQPLVENGEVPCQDREGALTALRVRPVEIFDFHHPNAVTAHWARDNFTALGQRFSIELAQRSGRPILEVAFWVDALFRFASTPAENTTRLRTLTEEIHGDNPSECVLLHRLEALLGMLSLLMRVVLVADNLEGFSADESAALKLAAFLGDLRQSVERLDVILSINQDIWQSAFVPRLSDGLSDRLSEVVIELNPLTEDEMLALLESRVPGLGPRMLASVDRAAAGTHARGLIRAAGIAWLRASAMDAPPICPPTTPVPPIPSLFPLGNGADLTEDRPLETDHLPPATAAPEPLETPPPQPAAPETAPSVEKPAEIFPPKPEAAAPACEPPPAEIPTPEPVAPETLHQPEPACEPPPAETPVPQPMEPEAAMEPPPAEIPPAEPLPVTPDVPRVSPFTIVAENDEPPPPGLTDEPTSVMQPAATTPTPAPEPPDIPVSPGALTAADVTLASSFAITDAPPQPATLEPAAAAPPPETAPPPAEPTPPDPERVDTLLKQFLERYGRDSK